MKETKVQIIASTQGGRVGVKETFRTENEHKKPGGSGPEKPKTPKPRGMPKWFEIWSQTKFEPAQQETNSRLDHLEQRVEGMNNIIEYNVQVGILKRPK